MADDRLKRFLHLERPRGVAAEPDAGPSGAAGRFGAVERPGAPVARAARTGAELDRFGPEPEPRIELLEPAAGGRSFVRCMRCGADASAFATRCDRCDADLDTPEQRAFAERFWLERDAQDARERATEEERRAIRERAEAQDRRALGEAIAREVGGAERRRIEAEGFSDSVFPPGGGSGDLPPPVVRVLRAVGGPARRAALAAAIALPGALLLSRSAFGIFLGIAVVLFLLAPPAGFPTDPS